MMRWVISCPDHPRSCGANSMPMIGPYQSSGSSPLVRGQPRPRLRPHRRQRIIPARAGPTTKRTVKANSMTDHPRSCGANSETPRPIWRQRGSSPLVRGQPQSGRTGPLPRRIIPARAGPTESRYPRRGGVADHPRSCGANRACRSLTQCMSGSSPLVRGQPPPRDARAPVRRIIPARAGPTPGGAESSLSETDHPRSCGANELTSSSIWRSAGSSPLVRGQPARRIISVFCVRIIPARAGPTAFLLFPGLPCADHPRSCGANHRHDASSIFCFGSSPLVRGQLAYRISRHAGYRIIPARAGPTPSKTLTLLSTEDHPRSCGANT